MIAYLEKNSAWILPVLEFVPDLTSMLVCSGFARRAVLIVRVVRCGVQIYFLLSH